MPNKIIPNLEDLYNNKELMGYVCPSGIFSLTNLDDIFRELRTKGITEVKVNWNEMLMIALWVVANIEKSYADKNWTAIKILREGKIDKFLGIKLHLKN